MTKTIQSAEGTAAFQPELVPVGSAVQNSILNFKFKILNWSEAT
jgi:hypothetical protein